MFKGVNKIAVTAALSVGLLSACSSRPENTQAEGLYSDIEQAMEDGQYEKAIILMDSMDMAYPEMTELRGRLLKMRPSAMEGWTLAEIQKADCDMAYAQMLVDSLSKMFEKISDPKLVEAYYVHKKGKVPDIMSATAVEPRLDEHFGFYIVSSLQGKNIGLNSIGLSVNGHEAYSGIIPYGDDRSFSGSNGQKTVFSGKDVEEIGILAANNPESGKLVFRGNKGSHTIAITQRQVVAIGDAYKYSEARKSLVSAQILREKLERKLQIARNQMANIVSSEDRGRNHD